MVMAFNRRQEEQEKSLHLRRSSATAAAEPYKPPKPRTGKGSKIKREGELANEGLAYDEEDARRVEALRGKLRGTGAGEAGFSALAAELRRKPGSCY